MLLPITRATGPTQPALMSTASSSPLIVITPARNAAKWITDCLDSVAACLDVVSFHVVVDDGSDDDTWALVQDYASRSGIRILPYRIAHLNQYAAMNHAIASLAHRHAILNPQEAFVAFLDADDIAQPDRFRHQLQILRDDDTLLAVSGPTTEITADGTPRARDIQPPAPPPAKPVEVGLRALSCPLPPACGMFRASVFRDIGGFLPVPTMGDTDFAMRVCFWCALSGRNATNTTSPVIRRRIHPDQVQQTVGRQASPIRVAIERRLRAEHAFFATMLRAGALTREMLWRPVTTVLPTQ